MNRNTRIILMYLRWIVSLFLHCFSNRHCCFSCAFYSRAWFSRAQYCRACYIRHLLPATWNENRTENYQNRPIVLLSITQLMFIFIQNCQQRLATQQATVTKRKNRSLTNINQSSLSIVSSHCSFHCYNRFLLISQSSLLVILAIRLPVRRPVEQAELIERSILSKLRDAVPRLSRRPLLTAA